ncbi:DNA cytosine methyltransferase [Acinetobacter sp. Ac_5812]|uniref:DNA cytosine methyltransferase n=1 Tax=Acinetobacter sp. Ac_5812 TaxID=1848937 RepID=UPI0014900A8B|nr:DNA cytosine methyltransferase [Acinetobacter sp. Ac_5812]NNP68938.1 DNA (cytosine-5-)-methyltransferase [Acinetobacter sp. Ac_5812]
MRYGSVCSGIEAATVAWHSLGFEPAWFAEIEEAPSLILGHHYPDIPNLGDMTLIRDKVRRGEVEAPDVLVGGTPCQAYSVAGKRLSLDDERGQLTLEYVRLLDAIDDTRSLQGKEPCIAVWENVPGVLSPKDNAFGCFLGDLAGSGCELQSSGRKWPNAGCVLGPSRQVYWRVLDAQFFGLAQRRKRVFVVASARAESIGEILFERKSLLGDSTQGSSKRQSVAADRAAHTTRASETVSGKTYLSPLLASHGEKKWLGNQEAFCGDYYIKHAIGVVPRSLGIPCTNEQAPTLTATDYKQPQMVVECIGVGAMTANAAISKGLYPTLLARQDRGYLITSYGIQGTLINRTEKSGPEGLGCKAELSYTLTSTTKNAVVYCGTKNDALRDLGDDIAPTLRCGGKQGGPIQQAVFQYVPPYVFSLARYLTEVECERLQGFPDNYTQVPKVAVGKRYKTLGNSMAVHVMHWIGKRLRTYLLEAA